MRRKLKANRLLHKVRKDRCHDLVTAFFIAMGASMKKIELRCGKCRKLLGRVSGSAEIKCSRCGTLNKYDAFTNEIELVPKASWKDRR